jgi:DNA-binding response OmpR family regulator
VKQTTNTGASASPAAKAPAEPLRVLVAEDDSDTRRTLVELLRSEGHLVEGAVSASDFWRVFHRLGPAVCLIDIGLPDRSGYEIAQEMTRRYGNDRPKLVAVTAWTKPSDRILARMAGFDRHVAKPYDPTALLALVSDITHNPEA